MKKTLTFLLAACAWCIAQAGDDNTFYLNDAVILPGGTANVELGIRNTAANLTCLEAEIQLPEDFGVVLDEDGNPKVTLYGNRTAGHEVLAGLLDNGNLKLLVSSVDGHLFKGEEGVILAFAIEANEEAQVGEYTMETVGESLLVSNEASAYYSAGVMGNILITDDPTGINLNADLNASDEAIYNLAGQRLSRKQKGVNIIGGRKIAIK